MEKKGGGSWGKNRGAILKEMEKRDHHHAEKKMVIPYLHYIST